MTKKACSIAIGSSLVTEILFLFYIKTQKSHLFLRLIHSCHQSINLPASDATFQL